MTSVDLYSQERKSGGRDIWGLWFLRRTLRSLYLVLHIVLALANRNEIKFTSSWLYNAFSYDN